MSTTKPVTINFLGVKVLAKFRSGKYDYSAKIPYEQAQDCYRTALHRLTTDSVPYGFNIQVSVGVALTGKKHQVTLFRYVKNGNKEDVQCILNLRFGESGNAEISVTYTTFGLMVELEDIEESSEHPAGSREVMLWDN